MSRTEVWKEDDLTKVSETKELGVVEKKDGEVELGKEEKTSKNPKPEDGSEDKKEKDDDVVVDDLLLLGSMFEFHDVGNNGIKPILFCIRSV